jgi:hypothetical protein
MNMRDFHDHLLSWVAMEPNPAAVTTPPSPRAPVPVEAEAD